MDLELSNLSSPIFSRYIGLSNSIGDPIKFFKLFILLSDCNAVLTVKRGSTGAPERLPVLSSNSTLLRYEPARVVQSIKSLHCPWVEKGRNFPMAKRTHIVIRNRPSRKVCCAFLLGFLRWPVFGVHPLKEDRAVPGKADSRERVEKENVERHCGDVH